MSDRERERESARDKAQTFLRPLKSHSAALTTSEARLACKKNLTRLLPLPLCLSPVSRARARCTHITSASPLSPRTRRRSRLWRFSPGIEEDETTVSGVYDGVHTLRKQLYPLARTNDPYLCRRRDHPRRPCAFARSRPFLALLATPVLLFALYRAATCVYGRRISMWSA